MLALILIIAVIILVAWYPEYYISTLEKEKEKGK